MMNRRKFGISLFVAAFVLAFFKMSTKVKTKDQKEYEDGEVYYVDGWSYSKMEFENINGHH